MSGSTSSGNVIGSGSDSITFKMSEDQAVGVDAMFTVNVDGQQIGGLQTVTASHAAGQDETFTFNGNYAPGPHNVTVTFDNNFIYPGDPGDRNLYVDGVSYDGQTVSNTTTALYVSPFYPPNSTIGVFYGNSTFGVNDTTAIPPGTGPNPTETPAPVSIGSGADTLVLNTAEDAYLGDAQFTVSVDGKQIGGTQTTTAISNEGQQQEFDVHGDFGPGTHTVSVDFTNDQIGGFYPGTTWAIDTTDRNLYVLSASIDGGPTTSGAPWELSSNGSHDFSVTSGSNQAVGSASGSTSATAAITPDTLASGSTSSGSSTGMSFVAPATTTTAASSTTDTSSTTGSSSTTPATTTMAATTPTATDYTPTVAAATTGATTPAVTGGNHWATYHSANSGGAMFHQHG